jgi:hypothetical protein
MTNKNIFPVLLIGLIVFILTGCAAGGGSGSGTGVVTLSWTAPTTNTDRTPLTDLAGYKIYYGPSSGNYITSLDVGNSTSYILNNLTTGTYYIAITSYNTAGIESTFSNEVSKTL